MLPPVCGGMLAAKLVRARRASAVSSLGGSTVIAASGPVVEHQSYKGMRVLSLWDPVPFDLFVENPIDFELLYERRQIVRRIRPDLDPRELDFGA